jgi:hypothetical protein
MPGFKPGDEVRFCDGTTDRRAQVTETTESGEVLGIAVYAGNTIDFGVTPPRLKLATTPQHRITDGHFWKQG